MEAEIELIIRGCQTGDSKAQRELYEVLKGHVHRFIVRLVPAEDVADTTCEVFVRIFQSINGLRRPGRLLPWVYRICLNECLLQRRREGRRPQTVSLPDGLLSRTAEPTKRLEDQELLEAAFRRLEPEYLATFLLRESEGLSYGEIAYVTKVSEGTVASRLSRARKQLREALIDLGVEL